MRLVIAKSETSDGKSLERIESKNKYIRNRTKLLALKEYANIQRRTSSRPTNYLALEFFLFQLKKMCVLLPGYLRITLATNDGWVISLVQKIFKKLSLKINTQSDDRNIVY